MKASRKRNLLLSILSLIIVAVTLGSLLIYQHSMAKYTSSIDGEAEYEPALFNTVLLGNLSFTHEVEQPDGSKKEVVETNGKLASSIVVDSSMDFGAVEGKAGDMTSDERRLRPGSVIAIPFTVTNGTTLPSETTGEKGNLAQTDILYSISLITTVNLPLVYDVYSYTTQEQLDNFTSMSKNDDYNYANYIQDTDSLNQASNDAKWGTKLVSQKGDITESPLIGHSCTYEVRPTTYDKNSTDEEKNLFSLERDESNANISVDRYMIVISWPTGAEFENNRDTKYMKEIDILEIRLEVLSWVKNSTVETPSYTDATKSVLAISAASIGNEAYYMLPSAADNPDGINDGNVFARSTVPFYATRSTTGVNNTRNDYLDFVVTNSAGQTEFKWNETLGSYEAVTKQNALSNSHVAIALPVQDVMGTKNKYTDPEEFEYYIQYNGKDYVGILTDRYITTDVWGKEDEDSFAAGAYDYRRENAYQILEFYELLENDVKTLMTLEAFTAEETTEQELKFVIKNKNQRSFDNTDNFKILVYSGSES